MLKGAAVFLHDAHFAVPDGDAGLEVHEVGTQRGDGGAAPALAHVIETIQKKAGLYLLGLLVQHPDDFMPGVSFCSQPGRIQREQALCAGKVAGIDHIDVGKRGCGQAGVLIAAGHLRADGDADDGIEAAAELRKAVGEFADVDCGRRAERAACIDVRKDILRRDVDAVLIELPILDNGQRQNGDIVLREQRFGQIAGGIRNDFDRHGQFPFRFMGSRQTRTVGASACGRSGRLDGQRIMRSASAPA